MVVVSDEGMPFPASMSWFGRMVGVEMSVVTDDCDGYRCHLRNLDDVVFTGNCNSASSKKCS